MKVCIGMIMIIFLFCAVTLAALNAADNPATSHDEIASLVMTTCTKCHDTKRICKNIEKKTRDEWDTTVTRMIKKGARLSVEDKDQVVGYFFSLTPGSKPLCE